MNNRLTVGWLFVFLGITLSSPYGASALSEDGYFDQYEAALSFYETGNRQFEATHGFFEGVGKVHISFRKYDVKNEKNEKKILILLPGRGEPLRKYAEVIYDLRDLGFSIYAMEHRGQGESGAIDGCHIQYVENFDAYVEDFGTFMREIVKSEEHPKRFLLAHSMGATIAALYAIQKDPSAFTAAALTAPMFDMNTKGLCKQAAHDFAWFACKLGLGKTKGTSDNDVVTSSKVRAEMTGLAEEFFVEWKSHKISYQWVLSALNALREISDEMKRPDSHFPIPTLMLKAGQDRHVPAWGQDQFCAWAPNCVPKALPDAYHELLMEKDLIRNQVLQEIREYFTQF